MYIRGPKEQLEKQICYMNIRPSVPEKILTFNKYNHGRKAKNPKKLRNYS